MKKLLLSLLLFSSIICFAQQDKGKWLRAFPVTSYSMPLNDSVMMVQLLLPWGLSIVDKQLGLLRGTYHSSNEDTVQKGYGRCHLIKGNYYYFVIGHNTSGKKIAEGDLIYTFMDTTAAYYGQLPKLAAHFIELQDVYETKFFDRYSIFDQWTMEDEKAAIDLMVKDIRFTGNYFLQNDASMDKLITSGTFKSRKVLSVMTECEPVYVKDFLDYVIARPRLYAGRQWKTAEVFA
jgi:hypothetical protein